MEKIYSTKQFVAKLRRLADALESGKRFQIQIAGERVTVPAGATFNFEHERGMKERSSVAELVVTEVRGLSRGGSRPIWG